MDELLAMLKEALFIVDMDETSVDRIYTKALKTAKEDLLSEDISEDRLNSSYGKEVQVFYASLIIDKQDIATNPTLNLMKNKLSIMTKGDRYEDGKATGSNS